MPYNTGVNRGDAPYSGNEPLVPDPMVASIIQELPKASFVLQHAAKVQMSTRTQRQPVLDVLPTAYFVSGDSGLKQTTNMEWTNVNLVAEEIAVIVPVPDAYLADASIDLWGEIRPRIVEAFAKKIDAATLFGTSKPSTWSTALVPAAIAAGNTVSLTSTDIPLNLAELAEKITLDGYSNVNGWAARPGFKWRLAQVRATDGHPIYDPMASTVYGLPFAEVDNGAWDPTSATVLAGDWRKAIVGMRQDITFKMFDQGVISDGDGAVVWNAMQQDGQAMRVTMRLAWAHANPVTNLNSDSASRFPFGVAVPGSAAS